ncbi:hypothetical protein YC2023_029922 [Brassica napus]
MGSSPPPGVEPVSMTIGPQGPYQLSYLIPSEEEASSRPPSSLSGDKEASLSPSIKTLHRQPLHHNHLQVNQGRKENLRY